jgi:cytochrome c oxidase subunit 1/cytochrome c oxidase subunit I+III
VIPVVTTRHPLWEDRLHDTTQRSSLKEGMLLDHGRETVGTTVLDADPDVILRMPGDSPAPLLLAIGLAGGCAGLLLHSWIAAAAFGVLTLIAMAAWLWPETELGQTAEFARD